MHLSVPVITSSEPPIVSTLDQVHNCSTVTSFTAARFHWYAARPFSNSLNSTSFLFINIKQCSSKYALCLLNTFININIRFNFYMVKQNNRKIAHCGDHGRSLMIKHIDIWEFPFNNILLRCCAAWVMNYKNLCFLSFLSIITILYSIDTYIWINNNGFILTQRMFLRIGWWGLNCFHTNGPFHFLFLY